MSNWTVPIDDSSSFINYQPHGDGGVGNWTSTGWQPWFSDEGFNSAGGEYGGGETLHITAFPGASLNFQFYGTGINLYGTANCTFDVEIDGSTTNLQPVDGPLLFGKADLSLGSHNVTLTAHPSNGNNFAFDRADVSRPFPDGKTAPTPLTYQATNTSAIQYTGSWVQQTDPKGQIPSPYYSVSQAPASLSFEFQGYAVSVTGARNWGEWLYTVDLDGVSSTYNASTMWLIGDALLFYQDGLDETATHTLKLTPTVGGGDEFRLNTINVFGSTSNDSSSSASASGSTTVSSTSSSTPSGNAASQSASASHKSNAGAIAGGVIAAVVVVIAIVVGLLFWRRRRRQRDIGAPSDKFTPAIYSGIDDDPRPLVSQMESATPDTTTFSPAPRSSKLAELRPNRGVEYDPSLSVPATSAPSGGSAYSSSAAPTSPPASAAGVDVENPAVTTAAVDRLIQIIADRIDHSRPDLNQSGHDQPPPGYME